MSSGFYDNPGAAEPRSVVVLKKAFGEIPAGTKVLWVAGDREQHNTEGLFGGLLPADVKVHIIPIEDIVREDSPEVAGIDFETEEVSENEYMKRYDISQIKAAKEPERLTAKNIRPFHKEKKAN